MIQIFLSRPNPFTYEQDYFINELLRNLKLNKIESITLKAKDYNPYESLSCLHEMIKRCYGMIILAFGQYYIEYGTSKKGAVNNKTFFESKESDINNVWVTSPFCHIEGTLAFGHKLPLFLLTQKRVKVEGILKKGDHAINGPQFSLISLKEIDIYFKSNEFQNAFESWKQNITSLYKFINKNI